MWPCMQQWSYMMVCNIFTGFFSLLFGLLMFFFSFLFFCWASIHSDAQIIFNCIQQQHAHRTYTHIRESRPHTCTLPHSHSHSHSNMEKLWALLPLYFRHIIIMIFILIVFFLLLHLPLTRHLVLFVIVMCTSHILDFSLRCAVLCWVCVCVPNEKE